LSASEKQQGVDGRIGEFFPHASSAVLTSPVTIDECWATLDGARLRYLRAGSGPPLLLIHGLLGYSFSWRFTLPAFAPSTTVYAVDLLGTGFSDRPERLDCGFRATAEGLLRFIDQMGISSFDVLATSHGGAVAMMLAALCADRPDKRLNRLILAAPVNPWSPHGRLIARLLGNQWGSSLFLKTFARMPLAYDFWLNRMYGDSRRIPPGTLEGYSAPLTIPGSFEHGLDIMRCWNTDLRELESVLPKISDYPTLLIWGNKDRAVYPSSADTLRRCFKDCALSIIEGAGHLPYEETPEEFNRIVIDFLTATS